MQLNLDSSGLIQALATNRPAKSQSTQAILLPERARPLPDNRAEAPSQADDLDSRLDALLEYEQQVQSHKGAIAQYLLTQHAAKREEIQLMVGIDLYA